MTKGPHEAFQICNKALAQGITKEGRRESTLFFLTKMEGNVLLTEQHIFSTMTCCEYLYLFPEKYKEPLDNAR